MKVMEEGYPMSKKMLQYERDSTAKWELGTNNQLCLGILFFYPIELEGSIFLMFSSLEKEATRAHSPWSSSTHLARIVELEITQ
jgi:hypothetical protein